MTARYLGSLTVGGALPGVAALVAAGLSGIGASLPELQSKRDALAGWTPGDISIAAQLTQLEGMIAALKTQQTLGVKPPTMAAQLANIAALIGELSVSIASLEAQRSVLVDAQQLLVTAGVHALQYTGRADRMGAELGGLLASAGIGPADSTQSITLATTSPAVFEALSQLVKVG